jgi:hypothetical protein
MELKGMRAKIQMMITGKSQVTKACARRAVDLLDGWKRLQNTRRSAAFWE